MLEISQSRFIEIIRTYFDDSVIKNIMEVGSLNGNDSLLYKTTYPNANVYCIEGLKDNFDQYLKNSTLIIPIHMVISDYDGLINFHKKNINGLHGILNRGDIYGTEIIKDVECKTIKTLCSDYSIDTLDMVKIDVEGATYEILVGMGEIINNIKIMHIETESYEFFKGQKLHNVVSDFLIEKGFTMLELSSVTIESGQQHDSVWINNKFLK